MMEFLALLGFAAMVLTPCGVALFNRRERRQDAGEPAPAEVGQQPAVSSPPVHPIVHAVHEAAVEVWAAQVAAAQTTAHALTEASRLAAKRVEVAEKAAEAAHRELTMAHQAAEALRKGRRNSKGLDAQSDALRGDRPPLKCRPARSSRDAA